MKKIAKFIFFVIIVFIFAIFAFNTSTRNSIYTIDSAVITYNLSDSGILSIVKTYHIRMVEPYRYITLYEYLKFGHFLSKPNITTSKPAKISVNFSNRKFDVKLMFSKDMNTKIVPRNGGDEITVVVSYMVDGVTEVGKDYKLLSMKVWNENVDTSVKNITFIYKGPSPIETSVYSSSRYKLISKTSSGFTYDFYNVKPEQPIVMDAYYGDTFSPQFYYTSDKYKKDLPHPNYSQMKIIRSIWYVSIPILMILLYVLIFKFLGKEYEIENIGEYYREIPFKDNPILVNSIVKLSVNIPDRDGINSLLLSMVKNKTIEFVKHEKTKKIVGFKIVSEPKDDFEREFLRLFEFGGNEIIFKDIERQLKRDTVKAKEFYEDFSAFKSYVVDMAKSKNFLSKKGYYASLLAGIFAIFNAVIMIFDFSSHYAALASMEQFMSVFSVSVFSIGLMPFFLDSTIFGRWTKSGIEYYRKFKGLEKFLTDYSLISEKPPESLIIWEDYLVYATALGIGNKVRKMINKLNVVEMKENDIYYASQGYYVGSLYALSTIGAPKSDSNSGGFGGTSAGGGFGGGGMSAG